MTTIDQRTFSDEKWKRIQQIEAANIPRREADEMWGLFQANAEIEDGFGLNQQQHALIMAAMACNDPGVTATEPGEVQTDPDEFVLVTLLHDVAKPLSMVNHPAVAAEILKPRISDHAYLLIKHHSTFLGSQIHKYKLPEGLPSYQRFVKDGIRLSEYDALAVDPQLPQMPLEEAKRRIYALYGIDI